MEGPPIISVSNEPVPESTDSSNIIDHLEKLGCATWHPLFIRDFYQQVLENIQENVKYDSPSKDNKWGYEYNISKFLKSIPLNLDDYMSVKNYIVLDNFTYFNKDGKNYYSVRNPRSVYEIFWSWLGNEIKLDSSVWHDKELEGLRNLHQKFKKKYNQYTFFTTDEEGLNIITSSYLYLKKKELRK